MNTATILTILLVGTGLIFLTLGLTLGRNRFGINRPSIDIDFDHAKSQENKHR
ncbi:MAG: hypothetical protein KKB70_06735 [Proteobacteria bacterium]|nr:hypothetical protein [Pseudomonadota bacterium]MBU1610296.1 hypothetical protein [Pseudomonadota bacterium]